MTQNNNPNTNQKTPNDRQGQQGKPQGQFPNKAQPQQANKRPEDERRPGDSNRPMSDRH